MSARFMSVQFMFSFIILLQLFFTPSLLTTTKMFPKLDTKHNTLKKNTYFTHHLKITQDQFKMNYTIIIKKEVAAYQGPNIFEI